MFFEWIKPNDVRWMEWTSLTGRMLVMLNSGPAIVNIPIGHSMPYYDGSENETAYTQHWIAWSAIPTVIQNENPV